jgi:hypothetical protein
VGRGARFVALAGLVVFAGLAPACGGGGGGGPTAPPSPTPTPTPAPGITFTAASAGPGVVLGQGAGTNTSTLVLEVRASQVTGLYGVAFDLDYPSAALRYQSVSAGSFLGSGSQISLQVAESPTGHLIVGLSRLGSVAGVDGSGVLLQLSFNAVASGGGTLAFSRNAAYKADGTVLSVPWAAGSVTVVR